MAWEKETWIDDDGSLTVGTEFDAAHMNNIETGVEEALEGESGDPDKNFVYTQGPAADTWVILHELDKIPSVTIFDSEDNEIEGQIVPLSDNEIEILFNVEVSGKAVLN